MSNHPYLCPQCAGVHLLVFDAPDVECMECHWSGRQGELAIQSFFYITTATNTLTGPFDTAEAARKAAYEATQPITPIAIIGMILPMNATAHLTCSIEQRKGVE